MEKQDKSLFDVVIIGAGPTGLAFAKGVSGQGLKIAIIDPAPEDVLANPAYDGREIALTHFSNRYMGELGILDEMPPRAVSMIKHAHVINGDSPYALQFDHREAGEETLGYMASNQNIRKASFAALKKSADDVMFLLGKKAVGIKTSAQEAVIDLDDGQRIEARLVVASDGRFSNMRRMMGIKTDVVQWGRSCLVGVMEHDGDHKNTAYECFHYDRTLAVLPLNDGKVSVVITLPSDEAHAVLSMPFEEFSRDIEKRFEYRVGNMQLTQTLHAYELACTYAKTFVADRFALLGDAAVGMHPVTAHGYNLIVSGAHRLAEGVKMMARTGGDIGSPVVLNAYNRGHNIACKPIYLGTNMLVNLYTDTRAPAKIARKALLHLGNVLKPAKDMITRQLTSKSA